MNSMKCKKCGLSNFASATECRRCGFSFVRSAGRDQPQVKKKGSHIWSLLMLAGAMAVIYCFYSGVRHSVDEVNAEANRAAQPAGRPEPQGLSRTEYDRRRAGSYGTAVRESNSLAQHDQHIRETERAMQQASGSSPSR
jgi:ribosomal protein L40E